METLQNFTDIEKSLLQNSFYLQLKNENFILSFCEKNSGKIKKVNTGHWGECLLLNYNNIISLLYSKEYNIIMYCFNGGIERINHKPYFGYFGHDKVNFMAWDLSGLQDIEKVFVNYYNTLYECFDILSVSEKRKNFYMWLNEWNKNYKNIDEYRGDYVPSIE